MRQFEKEVGNTVAIGEADKVNELITTNEKHSERERTPSNGAFADIFFQCGIKLLI